MLWQPYWIFGVRKSSKWVHIYTIIFGDPRNLQIDTKFIVTDILQVKLGAVICLNSHFGGHLGFLKTLSDAIFASFRSSIYRSQRFRINQEQLCGLHFLVKPENRVFPPDYKLGSTIWWSVACLSQTNNWHCFYFQYLTLFAILPFNFGLGWTFSLIW